MQWKFGPTGQLNALNRLNRYLGFEEKKILIKSFLYGNFNAAPYSGTFVLKTHWTKSKIFEKEI